MEVESKPEETRQSSTVSIIQLKIEREALEASETDRGIEGPARTGSSYDLAQLEQESARAP